MSPAPHPRPSSRAGARPAAPRRGRPASPGATEVPAGLLALRRPAGVLPTAGAAGAVDVLWVLSTATAAVVVAPSALSAGTGIALVLALRLVVAPLLPAAVAAPRERVARRAGQAVRAAAAVLLVVTLGVPSVTGSLWAPLLVAALALVAELARPPAPGGGAPRVLAAALPALAAGVVLGALGRALDAVTGVLAAPAPALLAVAVASVVLAVRSRGTASGEATEDAVRRPRPSSSALREVVGTAHGAARCAALLPVVVSAALTPLHVVGLSAGAAGAALLVLATAGGALLGAAGAVRWPAATSSPGTVLALCAGTSGALVVLAGPVTDLVLAAVLLALAGAAGASAVVASGQLPPADRPVAGVREAEGAVLAVVTVLSATLAGAVGGVTFPLGAAGALAVGGAGVVMLLVGLASVLTAVVVVRVLSDRPEGPLVPVLVRRGDAEVQRRDDAARPGDGAARAAGPGGGAPAGGAALAALGAGPASPHGLPGVLVALEGGDGSGKSTQATRLGRELGRRGAEVVLTGEPGGTPLGAQVRTLLLDRGGAAVVARAEALLYAADRASHVGEVLRPALERGAVVVTDRYVDSSLAYQGAGRSLPRAEVGALSAWASEGLVPDLVVVLDVDASTSLARRHGRGEDDRLDAEPAAFHARVREVFLELARAGGDRYVVVDATAPVEEVTRRLLERLEPLLPSAPSSSSREAGPSSSPSRPETSQGAAAGGQEAEARPATAVVPAVGGGGRPEPDGEPRSVQPHGRAGAGERVGAETQDREEAEEREAAEDREEAEEREAAEERRVAEERERRAAEERERRAAEERQRRAAEQAREAAQRREREAAERREREAAERREREAAERREREERARAEVRAQTSVRSAEAAVAVARALGDARRPVQEVGLAASGAPASSGTRSSTGRPLPVRLPEERLQQLPDAVRRSAVDVAGAQREARVLALQQLDRRERERQTERRRAAEEQRAAERRERERVARAEAEERERRRRQEMARREAQEARAEEERRAASRRRAHTEQVEVDRGASTSRAPEAPPRTAEMPAVAGETEEAGGAEERDAVDGRPALHELQAADRRRQAQQRARRRAAASRRRAEGDAEGSSVRSTAGRAPSDGQLADELFSMQDPGDELTGRAEDAQEPGAPGHGDGRR